MEERLVYVCSPLRGNMDENIRNAEKWCGDIVKRYPDVIPIAPHVYFTRFMDDSDEEERRRAISMGLSLLEGCSELWAFGLESPSDGMKIEIAYAKERGIPVRDGFALIGGGSNGEICR